MLLLDVNVVLAAHRDDHPHFTAVRPWFDALLAGDEPCTVPSTVWGSFLRLATHRRVFVEPTPRDVAFAFARSVVAQPHYLPTSPGSRHLALLEQLCVEADARGDLVADGALAAIAAESGAVIVTLDRDFARFRSVEHRLLPG